MTGDGAGVMSGETGMAEALARARRERVPEMALRPGSQRPDELDDIVVRATEMPAEWIDLDVERRWM